MAMRHSRRYLLLRVVVLILFGLLLTRSQLLHAHRSGEPGLYNTECPLAEIAARQVDASLPSVPSVVATGWTLEGAPAVAASPIYPLFARSADSRAPPLA